MKTKLVPIDHDILLCLIRGESVNEAAVRLGITYAAITQRLTRMRMVLDVRTTYQLVALEMLNLMESDCAIPAVQPSEQAKAAAA